MGRNHKVKRADGVNSVRAAAFAGLSLLSGCESPGMATDKPVADIAHSGKAIVITGSVEDSYGALGHLTPETLNTYVNPEIRTPGPDGVLRNYFYSRGVTEAYLVEPGSYFLAGIYRASSRTSFNFGPAESPIRFSVAAGEVLYLGELHLAKTANPGNAPCSVGVTLQVGDAWETERRDIEKILDDKYPGAKELVRKSPFHIETATLSMKPVAGCS
jgi:hypothetical protein